MDRPRTHVPYFHIDNCLERRSRSSSQYRHLITPGHPQVLQGQADDSRKSPILHSSFGFQVGLTLPSRCSGENTWDGQMEADW